MIIIASYSNVSVTYTADGTQTVFSFPFDYLRKAFVFVEVNEETILTQGTDYSVSDTKTVVFNTAPAAGTVLRIYRQTDTKPLVSWADASVLRAKDMTVQQIQELHILEETQEWARDYAIIRDGSEWNARNFPIKNVGDPVDDKDAINKQYLESEAIVKDDEGTHWIGQGLPLENIATPIKIKDAATKEYVDKLIDKLSVEADRYVVFNTVAAMKAADLPAGYSTETLGYYDINDGGAGVYNIRGKIVGEEENIPEIVFLDNGNVAEKIKTNAEILSNMIDEIDLKRTPFCTIIKEGNFSRTQGMCIAGNFLIVTSFQSNTTPMRLRVLDINGRQQVNYADIVIGHGNCLTYDYDNGYVYSVFDNNVYKIKLNGSDLILEETITSAKSANRIAYYGDGIFLVGDGDWNFWKTRDFNTFEFFFNSSNFSPIYSTTSQGMHCDDDFIYLPFSGIDRVERIVLLNKKTAKKLRVFEYPRLTYGECEDISTKDGYIYININRGEPFSSRVYRLPLYTDIAPETDVVRSSENYLYTNNNTGLYYTYQVDNSNVVTFPRIGIRVIGDSSTWGIEPVPFNNFYDALQLACTRRNRQVIYLHGNYENIALRRIPQKITIDGTDAIIGSLTITQSDVILLNLNAKQVSAELSTVLIDGGTLDGNNETTNAILNYRSLITGRITNIQNYTNDVLAGLDGYTNICIGNQSSNGGIITVTERRNAVINGHVYSTKNVSAISANTDIDNLTEIGWNYYCYTISTVRTLINCPTSKSFSMLVLQYDSSKVLQLLIDADSIVYSRHQTTSGWSYWKAAVLVSGTTEERITTATIGTPYYDTTLNKPIWWNGTAWVDATGAVV